MELQTLRYAIEDTASGPVATITFDEQGSPVNTMCRQWQDDLVAVTDQVLHDKARLRGLILASAKKTFFAGADLKGVMRTTQADATSVFTWSAVVIAPTAIVAMPDSLRICSAKVAWNMRP